MIHPLIDPSRLVSLGFAPGAQIHRVERDTKYVCRNESELRGPKTDDADHRAIDGSQNPTLPTTLSQQDG